MFRKGELRDTGLTLGSDLVTTVGSIQVMKLFSPVTHGLMYYKFYFSSPFLTSMNPKHALCSRARVVN